VSGLLELELERDVDMAGGCVDSGAAGKIDRKSAPSIFPAELGLLHCVLRFLLLTFGRENLHLI
jgi:hypothetical protein